MYKCADCKGRFAESLADFVPMLVPFEFWGVRGTDYQMTAACPFCGSDELDEEPKEEEHDVEVSETSSDAERCGKLRSNNLDAGRGASHGQVRLVNTARTDSG